MQTQLIRRALVALAASTLGLSAFAFQAPAQAATSLPQSCLATAHQSSVANLPADLRIGGSYFVYLNYGPRGRIDELSLDVVERISRPHHTPDYSFVNRSRTIRVLPVDGNARFRILAHGRTPFGPVQCVPANLPQVISVVGRHRGQGLFHVTVGVDARGRHSVTSIDETYIP